jgi:methyl-accepting chemotaxis protein
LLVAVISWMVARSILRPVDVASQVSARIARGDLTHKFMPVGTDEVGSMLRSMGVMQESLRALVFDVNTSVARVSSASTGIATASNDLSSRTEGQAAALEQTAASMEQLSSTVKQNAENAHRASEFAVAAAEVASSGSKTVADVVDTMRGINDSSRRISDIVGVIDGIAFQTNILALNASVEAARAGDQGRGFAVVASEVRSLANRAARAATEIKGLIASSVERVAEGAALVDKAGLSMAQVVTAIDRVSDMVGAISAASREQSLGVAQVGEAISNMDQATQKNAALVQQTAVEAAGLSDQARDLVKAVARFRLA